MKTDYVHFATTAIKNQSVKPATAAKPNPVISTASEFLEFSAARASKVVIEGFSSPVDIVM